MSTSKHASLVTLLTYGSLAFALPHVSSVAASASPDYVIIGGGPAGFVLAEQLSADPNVNVVLLEAGPDTAGDENVNTPGYAPKLGSSPYVWNYTCQPDPNLNGVSPSLSQGRGFGGGSAVNYMGSCRGAPSVFDEWAEISNDEGFRWDNFLNDFKATVHYKDQSLDYDPHINKSAYGNGPLEVTAANDDLGFISDLKKSWSNVLNLPSADLNDGTGLGISSGPGTIRASNRTRDYASQAYGWQLAGRPNARQLHDAVVTKIGFNGKRAVSVTYVNPNDKSTTTLKPKEIIVAAGAFGSPKLLMLSGVGPADDLKSLGIPVVADVPEIGKNLIDHNLALMAFEVSSDIQTLWQYTENSTFEATAEEEYRTKHIGPLGVPNGFAFAVSRIPDEEFKGINATYQTSLPPDRGHLMYQYSSSTLQANTPNVSIVSPFVALVQPESAGHMKLASSDYKDAPLIYTSYYGSAGDKAAILYGYKQLRKIIADPSLSSKIVKEIYPGSNVTSDDDLWHAITQGSESYHHPVGTVALGTAVEGKTWRVKGLQGIRVVDSSSMPTLPTCHIMATVYAYAYHAAQMIKKQDI